MGKAATIRARIEPHLKQEAENLLEKLGLTTTQAITIYYKQILLRKGLPFDVTIPNAGTRRVFEDTDAGRNLVRSKNAGEMFRKLGI